MGRRLAFRRGLRERSPLALLGAAGLVVAVLLLVQQLVVNGGLAAIDEGRVLRTSHDDFIHVSYRIAELRGRQPTTETTIYLLGGSGTMECIQSESSLAADVAACLDQPAQVVSLAAAQQTMAMSLALVDNLPPGPAVVLVGLSPVRLIGSAERDAKMLHGDPLLMSSPALERLSPTYFGEIDLWQGSLLNGIFAYVGSYLNLRGEEGVLAGSRITYLSHYWAEGDEGRSPLAKRLDVLTVLDDHKRRYAENGAYNLALLEKILRLGAARGYQVIIFDQPLNVSAGGRDWAGVVPAYRAAARRLAREYDVPYLHIERHVDLRDDDFADLFHLLAPARLKWQPEMARQLAAALGATEEPLTATLPERPTAASR